MQFIDLKAQQKKIREKKNSRIANVLEHGKYIMGPEVYELEKKLAAYVDSKHCISCSSGTDALLIPLMAMGIGKGDAVITTPFTYIATAEVISLLGATPVFVDVYEKTFNINPDLIGRAVKLALDKGLKPKAIIPVDLFGLPARYRLIQKEAKKYDLLIIEDAAQGFGGAIGKNKACSFGDVASTSFFPAKPLGCYGDGGAIFTNDDKLAELMCSIRVHGSGESKYENIRLGLNGRLDTIQAAILIEKFGIFTNEIESRNKIADYYMENISPKFKKPFVPKNYYSSWAQFSLIANSHSSRLRIMEKLQSKGVPSMIYYEIPLHLQPVFKNLGYQKTDFPVSEKIAKRIFSIPMHPYLELVDQNKILGILDSE